MSERVIAKKSVSGYIYEPDPAAPSVSEIVEVLRDCREASLRMEDGDRFFDFTEIENLIARLEDT